MFCGTPVCGEISCYSSGVGEAGVRYIQEALNYICFFTQDFFTEIFMRNAAFDHISYDYQDGLLFFEPVLIPLV